MQKLQKVVAVSGASAALLLVAVGDAAAASVIDAGMKTALENGFSDLIDTVKDVISTAWPFMLGATVLLAAPGLVQRMISRATAR